MTNVKKKKRCRESSKTRKKKSISFLPFFLSCGISKGVNARRRIFSSNSIVTWIASQLDSFATSPFKREFYEDSFVQPERTIELCTYWSNTCVNWYNACKEILRDSFFSPDINVISFDKITKNKRISMDQF